MGNEESTAQVHHDGDTHVEIINTQNEHSEQLNRNNQLLWWILIVVVIILGLQIITEARKIISKKVTKRARSLAELTNIAVVK